MRAIVTVWGIGNPEGSEMNKWCMSCLSDYVVEGDECPECGNHDPELFTDRREELEYAQGERRSGYRG